MSFEQILEKAESLLTKVKRAKAMAVEVGELHMELWDNRDISMRDYVMDPIPFYPAIEGVSTGLEDLIILMARTGENPDNTATLRQLFNYTSALSEPQRRVSMFDNHLVIVGFADSEKGHTTYYDSSTMITDPITSFNKYARQLLMSYSSGDTLFGGTVARDHFLMVTLSQLLKSKTFSKEGLEAASDEMIRALRHHLDVRQQLYGLDVEAVVKEYASILEEVQKEAVALSPELQRLKTDYRRHIFSLSAGAKGKFRVPKGIADGSYGSRTIRPAYQIRQEVVAGSEVLERMASESVPWSSFLPEIVDLIRGGNVEAIDKYPILEYKREKLVEAKYAKVAIEDIIGQEENVKRLGQLLYAFGEGHRIPNIVLYGKHGRGKTMSIRALADCHPQLRTILLSYSDIDQIREVIEKLKELPYQVVAYVDDMHFPQNFDVEQFKTETCGIKDDWPSNLALVVSVNPEAYDRLSESIKSRFGITLDYNRELDEAHWRKVFQVTARHEGVEYTDKLWDGFFRTHQPKSRKEGIPPDGKWPNERYLSNELDGRMVRDYIREQKALAGVNFPAGLRQA